jgi:aspartate/glutamate racemase
LSIIDETVAVMEKQKLKTVGLCSTGLTISHNIYNDKIKNAGIKLLTPTTEQQTKLNEIIIRIVTGELLESDRKFLCFVVKSLKQQGAEKVFLACTDLQVLWGKINDVTVLDTMQIMANATLNRMLKG